MRQKGWRERESETRREGGQEGGREERGTFKMIKSVNSIQQ